MIDGRWRIVQTVVPFLVLGTLTAFTVGIEWGRPGLAVDLALCGFAAVWVFVFRVVLMWWTEAHPAAIGVFVTVMIALNLVLVLRAGWFGFLAIATFSFAYALVEWPWQLLAVGATAVVAGIAQSSSFARSGPLGTAAAAAVIALNVAIMCGLSWGLRVSQRQDEQAGVDAERTRLAGEIHDTLAQNFAGIVTQLQAADEAPDAAARRRHSDAALALARDGLAEARRSVQALRPVALDAVRLPEAIANVARSWSERTGIRADVTTTGPDRALPTDAEVALLRTAQEALANVERHARAGRVTLALRVTAQGARLEVRDDGRGFDPATPPATTADHGYGLVAMRQRIEALAGELRIESRPGHGTAVLVEVPA
ncbi:sensor histidine kinase [Pseudolysinimonas kribbensis]|uniref:Oxygen sensor histidine kinase NreB n=1 Tax=Pseudolysinimonas kribbensis TaxID=433641 RepID=A0ABQ6KCR5_9MICO|nr:sensor histidine kinase [Pseudolysinimonas kribbensis]GMA96589.1 histidine kinase [Pseudolysinimonas kribbensis]